MCTAADPQIAAERLQDEVPDVITLDVEMPRMDGLTFIKKIMTQQPISAIVCSSLTTNGSETTFKALEDGAADFIEKPLPEQSNRLRDPNHNSTKIDRHNSETQN
jgi:two-component system chemotaxis response regulator CheB